MASTGTIRRIAIAAAETAIPSLPALGSNIDWSGLTSWETLGRIEDGDLADLDEDSMEISFREEGIDIDPPLAQNREAEILFKNGADGFNFVSYTFSDSVLALSSTASHASGETTEGVVITPKAVIVEITGRGVDYFPNCRIKVDGGPGGIKALRKVKFAVKVYAGASIPSGHKFKAFGS